MHHNRTFAVDLDSAALVDVRLHQSTRRWTERNHPQAAERDAVSGVAVFDNAQIEHSYSLTPLRLAFQRTESAAQTDRGLP
jgi:hypothetical protein